MASASRVTLRQIAAAAHVHVSTVSLALRGDDRLRPATRHRIQNLARRLSYASNPLTQSLAKYRSASMQSLDRPRVAWITHHPTPNGWKKLKTAQQSFLGAHACAESLGMSWNHSGSARKA
jgi:LacI family transcriptional regulator